MNRLAAALRRWWPRPLAPPVAATPAASSLPEQSAGGSRAALRTLAALLRGYGERPIGCEAGSSAATTERFRRFAEHVLSGTAVPGAGRRAGDERDWEGIEAGFLTQRRAECEAVEKTVGTLQDTLFGVLQRLGRSVGDGRELDRGIAGELQRLKRCAHDGGSVDQLQREVLATVDALGRALSAGQARQAQLLATLGAELQVLREELQQARGRMQTDGLTKLYNREALDAHLARVCPLAALSGDPACLLMVDIDHFKAVNDQHGHPAGDELLRRIADTLVRTFPRRTDFVARYGGEEFCVVLPQDGAEVARALSARLLLAVRGLVVQSGDATIRVTVSVGFAVLRSGEEVASWLARADQALYRAKRSGRDRVVESEATETAPPGAASLAEAAHPPASTATTTVEG